MGKPNGLRYLRMLGVALTAALLASCTAAFAEGPVSMAPPISLPNNAAPSADSVFSWNEVPENQDIPIERAVFDQGGYQLFDTVGETIVVPFKNDDLYVMKFAVSHNGSMYFVNTGTAPVLYVPRDGYLENATVPGARWYPFSDDFHPATPVYEGCAPSWSVFIGMGWYPGMCCYGGYWCGTSFWAGGVFLPCVGFTFFIGGHYYHGWGGYAGYWHNHPNYYHTGWYRRQDYGFAARSAAWHNHFGGTIGRMRAQGFVNRGGGFEGAEGFHGNPAFRGPFHSARAFHGSRGFHGATAFRGSGGRHVYRGAGRSFAAHHAMPGAGFSGGRSFGHSSFGRAGGFNGAHPTGGYGGGHATGGSHGGGRGSSRGGGPGGGNRPGH